MQLRLDEWILLNSSFGVVGATPTFLLYMVQDIQIGLGSLHLQGSTCLNKTKQNKENNV